MEKDPHPPLHKGEGVGTENMVPAYRASLFLKKIENFLRYGGSAGQYNGYNCEGGDMAVGGMVLRWFHRLRVWWWRAEWTQ